MTTATHNKTRSTNGHSQESSPVLSRAVQPPKRLAQPQPVRWTYEQYQKMTELGWFDGRRVELIGGEIIEMASMLHPHWLAGEKVEDALRAIFGVGYRVIVQKPLPLLKSFAPEPDIAIIRGALSDFAEGFPATALLVVEISDTTLRLDRTDKASLYAAAGIEDYWIVNLKARQLEVHRTPVEHAKAKFGWIYQEKTEFKETDSVSPVAAPESKITVADLLP